MRLCKLSDNKMEKLCEQFGNLSNLKYCNLSANALGEAVSALAESIKSWGINNTLERLQLRHCNITPAGCSRLLGALGVCQNLSYLVLSENAIGGAFHTHLETHVSSVI